MRAMGLGSIEAGRGTNHVSDRGVPLIGEADLFGPLIAMDWSSRSAAGTAWKGGVWMGRRMAGDGWTGSSWASRTWASAIWPGRSWGGSTWDTNDDEHTWTGWRWSGSGWAGDRWSSSSWN
jgi:serine protease AprX